MFKSPTMLLDAITSNPLNVFITIVCVGLAYLYLRGTSSSSSSSSSASGRRPPVRTNNYNLSNQHADEEMQQVLAMIERQERNTIMQEQDNAYQQSLKADKEKQLKREEERRKKEAEEKEAKERAARDKLRRKLLIQLKSTIVDKLDKQLNLTKESTNIVKLIFKLPNGSRVQKEFKKEDKVKLLYWFVFSLEEAPLHFNMTTNFPKRDLPGRPPIPEDFGETGLETNQSLTEQNCEETLEDVELTGSQILFVYDLEA